MNETSEFPTAAELVLERQGQVDLTFTAGSVMITPPISEDCWAYRVRVGPGQAVAAFPKFGTIGVGFAQEEDWNTNLPYTCVAQGIRTHIGHNRGDDRITDDVIDAAIRLIQEAIAADQARSGDAG